jgi:hypothetical protein
MHYDSNYYKLHVQNISFSQTFKQKSNKKKTLHSTSSLISGSTINEANPASIEMNLLMVDEGSTYQHKPLELLLTNTGDTLQTFDLYVDPSTTNDASRKMYKLDTCVFTTGAFEITREGFVSVALSAQASKLSRINYSAFSIGSYSTTPTYVGNPTVAVTVDGTVLENVVSVGLEVQNDVRWTQNNTIQNSLAVTGEGNSVFPLDFVLEERDVAGNITTYIGTQDSDLQAWKENIVIRIQAGLASNNYQLDAQLTPCSFTNRVDTTEVFTQGYDFRMMGSPTNLDDLFTY